MEKIKTGEENYHELKNDPQEMKNQLPWIAGAEKRFENCRTMNHVFEIFRRNFKDWDDPAREVAFFVCNQKFGHISVDEKRDNGSGELKKENQKLKMDNGRLKAQIERLKEK